MSIPVIDTTEFRRKVAGLIDPNRKPTGAAETESFRREAVEAYLIMREHFGHDVTTFPDKIPNAMSAAAQKCDDGDVERFLSLCLESVNADVGAVGRDTAVESWLLTLTVRDEAYRQGFIRHIAQKIMVISVHGRAAWEQRKMTKKGGAA